MNRGDRREIIFHDDFDRELILRPLGETWHKATFQIHAFCLRPSHCDIVVENARCEFHPGHAAAHVRLQPKLTSKIK
jgi:hypothetical protein